MFSIIAPTSPPVSVQGSSTDSTTITLTWMPPPAEFHNGIVREYLINITELETGRKFQQMSSTTSASLVMLHPYYVYQIAIAAVTVSAGPYSEALDLRTLEDGTYIQSNTGVHLYTNDMHFQCQ